MRTLSEAGTTHGPGMPSGDVLPLFGAMRMEGLRSHGA